MNRRKLLTAIGAVAAGGAAATGTGAFTSVDAERTVGVSVANEDTAYLGIAPSETDNGVFANASAESFNDQIELDFNDSIPSGDEYDPGTGVGVDSEYEFDDVFRVTNQGTQSTFVKLTDVEYDSDNVGIQFYVRDSSGNRVHIDGSDGEVELGTGNAGKVGVYFDMGDDASTGEYDTESSTITGQDSSFGADTTVGSSGGGIITD